MALQGYLYLVEEQTCNSFSIFHRLFISTVS